MADSDEHRMYDLLSKIGPYSDVRIISDSEVEFVLRIGAVEGERITPDSAENRSYDFRSRIGTVTAPIQIRFGADSDVRIVGRNSYPNRSRPKILVLLGL